MTDLKIKIGRNIKKFRKSNNLSQEKLAEIIGVSTISISNMENGRVLMSFETLEKITSVLGVELYEIFLTSKDVKEEILYKKLKENIEKPELKNNSDKLMILYQVSENLINKN